MTDQPQRPPFRGQNHYAALKSDMTAASKELFTITITAATKQGGDMKQDTINEERFLIDLIFKPNEPGLILRPEETQLLLAYIGEILKEIQEEEKLLVHKSVERTSE